MYCHECGEKIAQDDVYCPFCGIALQHHLASADAGAAADEIQLQATQIDIPVADAIGNIEKSSESFSPSSTADADAAATADDDEPVVVREVSLPPPPPEFETGERTADVLLQPQTSEHIAARTEEEFAGINAYSAQNEEIRRFDAPPDSSDEKILPAAPGAAFESGEKREFEPSKGFQSETELNSAPVEAGQIDFGIEPPSISEVVGHDAAIKNYINQEPPLPPPPSTSFDATIPYGEGFKLKEPSSPVASPPFSAPEQVPAISATDEREDDIKPPVSPLADINEEDKDDEILPVTLISAPLPPASSPASRSRDALQNFGASRPADQSDAGGAGAGAVVETSAGEISEPPQATTAQPAPIQDAPAVGGAADGSRGFTTPNVNSVDTGGKKAKLKTLPEGTVLNARYEIVRKIGGGGMGAVYLASDKNLGGVLRAVKEMVQSYIEDSQQDKAISDFRRESLLLSSLEHPAIPTIFDYFYDEKEGRFYLVMKYISGGDLAARLRSAPEGRVDEASVTEWAIQIADVLDYLHNRQPPIVYRDLKPSNIMIDGNSGKVMLIDFGIARWVNKEEKGVTAVGTMGYAPPELFSGNVEPRSDIYSLGSTMFHLLTGADPQNNPLLIFDFNKHPRPRQINPQLSDQMEQILMRSVEYNADRRFASAGEMRAALAEHLENVKAGRLTFGLTSKSAGGASASELSQPVFCGFCGQKIVASDIFCPFCGAKQPLAVEASAANAAASLRPPAFAGASKMTARLYVINTGELDAPVFNLEKDASLIGRRDPMSNIFPEVDLSKFDPQTKISRRHARIWREGEGFMVEDLGSSNGTLLVKKSSEPMRLLPQQPRPLAHGDKLKLGDTTLHFMLG